MNSSSFARGNRAAWLAALAASFVWCSANAQTAKRPPDGFIGGTATSARGPEAGVWVIAETDELKTPFIKIVVTDDAGRYVLPQLPTATYNVWVRGYGLADSDKVEGRPGDTALNLTAKIASSPRPRATTSSWREPIWRPAGQPWRSATLPLRAPTS